MIIKSKQELETYRKAAKISTKILRQLYEATEPGIFPAELDQLAEQLCKKNQVEAAFKGVTQAGKTYHHHSCISVNDEILHGIPDDKRRLQNGDLVKIDFGIIYHGFYTDHCFTLGLGQINSSEMKLLKTGREAVLKAVKLAKTGNYTGDLGHQMHKTAFRAGFNVFKQYIGHGIGHSLHDQPEIPAFGQPKSGRRLEKNMVICVECQVVPGSDRSYVTNNGWTVKTQDGKKGVMFEYMVRVDQSPEILTQTQNWALTKN